MMRISGFLFGSIGENILMKETTLCYIERDNQYLMLHRTKKSNDPNQEKWIGVGGKLEDGETIEECLLREVLEETGFVLTKYQYRATIYFYSDLYEDEMMHLYTASSFTGAMTECDEGELAWVEKSDLLHLNLWEGDRVFLQRLLNEDMRLFELKLYYKGESLTNVVENIR